VRRMGQILLLIMMVALGPLEFVYAQSPQGGSERLNIRSADHANSSRLVFDWNEKVDYTARIEAGELRIGFKKNAIPQWGQLERRQLKFLSNPRHQLDGNNLNITLNVTEGVRLWHFRSGSKIIVDVINDAPASNNIREQAQTRQPPEQEQDRSEQARAEQARAQQVRAEQIQPAPSTEPPSQQVSVSPAALSSGRMSVGVSRSSSNLQMTFPWQEEIFAAAFIRSDMLWVVFEAKVDIDHSRLEPYLGERILSARQIDHPQRTILLYELEAGQNLNVHKAEKRWFINLSSNRSVANIPVPVGQQTGGEGGDKIFFSAVNLGSLIMVDDPLIGDKIAVVPMLNSSHGVVKTRNFSEFVALETAQGIAIQLVADDLLVKRFRNGVSVSGKGAALALSKSRLSSKLSRTGNTERDAENPERLIDLSLWRKGPLIGEGYLPNRHELLYQLSMVTSDERNEARWNLARFYLGNGAAADALGVLDVMKSNEPRLVESSDFRAVYGVTNIFLRRYQEGVKYLTHKTLVAEPDSFLWRAVANEGLGNHKKAMEDFNRGADYLVHNEPKDRARILLAAVRAAYGLGDFAFMKSQLSVLKLYPMSADNLTEVEYWEAVMTQQSGNQLLAESEFEAVVKKKSRRTMAWARLALVNSEYASDKIDTVEAIDQLEKLRFAWRGDDFELDLLARLGELYFDMQEYDTGLEILKQAATYFEKSRKTRELTNLMTKIYRELFLDGKADNLSPVKSVALYMKFAELTPLGTEGDLMARRLANRLVSLDLLPQAEDILNHQIKHRLKGIAQAVVASRLAVIYILDAKPEEAMKILRATRQAQIPEDVEDNRIRIEARALIELGRYEEAEVLLEEKSGPEVDDLRSDIYWKGEDWDKFIRHSENILSRSMNENELNQQERQTILRLAVALSFKEDKDGIEALRQQYLTPMSNGLYAETFDVITAKQVRSGDDVRQLTRSIASVSKLETFMDSYRAQFQNAEN